MYLINKFSVFYLLYPYTQSDPTIDAYEQKGPERNQAILGQYQPTSLLTQTVHHSPEERQTGAMPLPRWQGVPTSRRLCAVAKGPG